MKRFRGWQEVLTGRYGNKIFLARKDAHACQTSIYSLAKLVTHVKIASENDVMS